MSKFQAVLATCATACSIALIWAVLTITATVTALPGQLTKEIQDTRQSLLLELDGFQNRAFGQIGAVNTQVAALRQDLDTNTKQLTGIVDTRLTESTAVLDRQMTDYRTALETENSKYVDRIDVALQMASEVQERLLMREPLVYSRFLATTGEAMRTLDAARRVSETAAEVAPRIAKSTEEIAAASAEATKNTAALMGNLNTLTKPKPLWQKIFTGVTALKVLLP